MQQERGQLKKDNQKLTQENQAFKIRIDHLETKDFKTNQETMKQNQRNEKKVRKT